MDKPHPWFPTLGDLKLYTDLALAQVSEVVPGALCYRTARVYVELPYEELAGHFRLVGRCRTYRRADTSRPR